MTKAQRKVVSWALLWLTVGIFRFTISHSVGFSEPWHGLEIPSTRAVQAAIMILDKISGAVTLLWFASVAGWSFKKDAPDAASKDGGR